MRLFENKRAEFVEYETGEGDLSVRFAHLSDLHFPRERVDCAELLSSLVRARPDAVLFSGDLVCRRRPLSPAAFAFLRELAAHFPVYFAEGNHEAAHPDRARILQELERAGVHNVTNGCARLEREGGVILIAGATNGGEAPAMEEGAYRILLLHRPELAPAAAKELMPDLIVSGHAHGGQFRLFGRGVYAPGQGLFPRYTEGLYQLPPNTTLLVSRGVGSSRFPFRLNNPPHVPVLTVRFSPDP